MKVLIIAPYPTGVAPSQRFRFEQYLDIMTENHINYTISPFLSRKAWDILYNPGHFFSKVVSITNGYIRRFKDIFRLSQFDFIFIHRESSPFGPHWFEYIAVKILNKKIIYDFDDSIWLKNYSDNNKLAGLLKRYSNTRDICKLAYKISAGNEFLASFASQYNKNVVINPTTIDLSEYTLPKLNSEMKVVVGWSGSHSTAVYLESVLPVFKRLNETIDYELYIISNQKPPFNLPNMKFIKWNKDTETNDLSSFDIGIMPLTYTDWSRGKCGLKALQYMALNIPSLITPVGVNRLIVDEGVNGMYCDTPDEWYENIKRLIEDESLRKILSSNARKKVEEHYSVKSNKENFLSLFINK